MRKIAILFGTLVLSVLMAQFAWAGGGVLLVDDDLSCVAGGGFYDVQSFYTDALEAARVFPVTNAQIRGEYELYEVCEDNGPDGPPFSKLQDYEVVIWFTGTTCGESGCLGGKCLTDNDEIALSQYLDAGGKLFLSAQDYLNDYAILPTDPDYSFSTGEFPYDYLKVSYVEFDRFQGSGSGMLAQGDPGTDAITEGLCFELENPFSIKGQLAIDKIQMVTKNQSYEFKVYEASNDTGYTGLSWDLTGVPQQGPALFFSTICFAALKDEIGTDNTKANLMSLIMSHFYGDYADYGDAPDPPFFSMYENYGARHINSDGVFEWLGPEIDLEFNSQQVDLDQFDDGVVFNTPFVPGETGSVDLTVSVSDWTSDRYNAGGPPPYPTGWDDNLYCHAWFDWNQDGDWDDPDENVWCGVAFNPFDEGWGGNSHTYNVTFPVPASAGNNDMWCRIRLQYHYNDNFYFNEHAYGEVEDYVLSHPLSVGLSTFYASAGDGQATLYWSTQSEVNNLGFYLLRSADGANYERVNQELLPGQGNSETRHDYSYLDKGLDNGLTYYYKVVDVDLAGVRTAHGPITVTPQASSGVPSEYALSQNYPNPFNAQTTISYAIPTASHVSLKVFNVLGEEVRTLVDADQQANTYQVTWDGRDAGGKQVASGVYFCKLQAGSFEGSTKMVFMK